MGTVISPNGEPATDIFMPGDLWYFPRGHGHALQNVGNTDAHFIIGFDDGHFSEYGTFSITDWVSKTEPKIAARNLGVSEAVIAQMPKKEAYIIQGKIPANIPEGYLADNHVRGRLPPPRDAERVPDQRDADLGPSGDRPRRHSRDALASQRRRMAV